MRHGVRIILCILALAFGLRAEVRGQSVAAAVMPDGHVELFWLPQSAAWPKGGWRIERVVGSKVTVIAERVSPGSDAAAMGRLDPSKQRAVRDFAESLRTGKLESDEGRMGALVVSGLAAYDPQFGRAVGLRFADTHPGRGPRQYRIQGLDSLGHPIGSGVLTEDLDPTQATPLPSPPSGLTGSADRRGVALRWADPDGGGANRPVGYRVVRRLIAGGAVTVLTPQTLPRPRQRSADLPAFHDDDPPKGDAVEYDVRSVDLFGRESEPAKVLLYAQDLTAIDPPMGVTAKAGIESVDLSWESRDNPSTSGYVVTRSQLPGGPWEVLNSKPLAPSVNTLHDGGLRVGSSYYYRLQSMGPRGDLGAPSDPASATPLASGPPPQVSSLSVDVETSRVRLTWEPVAARIAGYFVERRALQGESWARLNSRPEVEPRYDDYFGAGRSGGFAYRIVAVGLDNQESSPGNEIQVKLPDTVPPGRPRILSAHGVDGVVHLTFSASPPVADTVGYFLLRSRSRDEDGIVLGSMITAAAKQVEDRLVSPGQEYWYRMVAVDRAGNRSPTSDPIEVRVATGAIPRPAAPTAQYLLDPFPRVDIRLPAPPAGLVVVVLRQAEGETRWRILANAGRSSEYQDLNPPRSASRIAYAVLYQDAAGAEGPLSDAAMVDRPESGSTSHP